MARGKNQPLTEKDLLAGLAKLNKKPEELGFKKPLRNILGEAQGAETQAVVGKMESNKDNTERLRQMAEAIQGKISVERGASAPWRYHRAARFETDGKHPTHRFR